MTQLERDGYEMRLHIYHKINVIFTCINTENYWSGVPTYSMTVCIIVIIIYY